MKKLVMLFVSCLLFLGTAGFSPVSAADFRTGETVIVGGDNLRDLYLFGGSIRVESPVANDVVAAGGDISINKDVTGSLIVAGGNIRSLGKIGNTVRAAGGNITIDNTIARDLVISGGSIIVNKNAQIGGDVAFSGGTLVLDGPVKGNVIINGGQVTLNSTIDGNVQGEIESLILGPNARINGNLTYTSEQKANIANGAVISGRTTYTPEKEDQNQKEDAQAFVTAGALYKLATDIIVSLLLIYFFTRALTAVITRLAATPVQSGAIGFTFIILFPILAAISLILIWLGIGAFILYALIFLVSLFLVKIFLGWLVMRWWENRSKRHYVLDWKAGVIGPILLFILSLIPIIGWLVAALLFCAAAGALLQELYYLLSGQKITSHRALAKPKVATVSKKR